MNTCRTPNCTRPVRIIFRQLCSGCYEKNRRNGMLEGLSDDSLALKGGHWEQVRGVMRWVSTSPVDNSREDFPQSTQGFRDARRLVT